MEKCVSNAFKTGITEDELRNMVEVSIENVKTKE